MAFVRRPDEWGPEGPPDPQANMAYDFIADGFDGVCQRVLALRTEARDESVRTARGKSINM